MIVLKLRRVIALVVSFCVLSTSIYAGEVKSTKNSLGQTLVTDLVSAGISVAASLSGNVALALSAGLLTKYVTTYGIAGVKKLIDLFKGYEPRDLGEVNLYYVYLLNIKRNLYFTLINIRKAAQKRDSSGKLEAQLKEITGKIIAQCEEGEKECRPNDFDESMVNFEFLNIAMDLDNTMDISEFLQTYELKATYQYLMLLYLDIIIVEQKLIEAQYDVMANTITEIKKELDEHPYISNAEREYFYQTAMSIASRWSHQRANRRDIVSSSLRDALKRLQGENGDLDRDLDEYENRYKLLKDNSSDDYQKQLNQMLGDLKDFGISMNVFTQNPFQTGTALKDYYLGEKTLLLQRDTFFQLKANKLENTDHVADFHHRLKVLRTHGGNILLQLLKALEKFSEGQDIGEDFEEPKHQKTLDEILEECDNDAQCVAKRLANPETETTNILVDNFKLTAQLFKNMPQMHALEVASIYQLVQLIYLECIYGRIKVSKVEYELFREKQIGLKEAIEKNKNLTPLEKEMHSAVVSNTLKKWKLRIAKRKFDHSGEFEKFSKKLITNNSQQLKSEKKVLDSLPKDSRLPKCSTSFFNSDRQRCKKRKEFRELLNQVKKKNYIYINQPELKLPTHFWEKL